MNAPARPQEIEARVEAVIDVLSGRLANKWVEDLVERGLVKSGDEYGCDETETEFIFAFWTAARAIIRDLLVHGDRIELTRTPEVSS
jgi:hypothetical protein